MLSIISPRTRAIWGTFCRRAVYGGAKVGGNISLIVITVLFSAWLAAVQILIIFAMFKYAYEPGALNLLAGAGWLCWLTALIWAVKTVRLNPKLIEGVRWRRPFLSLFIAGNSGWVFFYDQLDSTTNPLALKRTNPLDITFYEGPVFSKLTPKALAECVAPSLDGLKMGWSYVRATPLLTLVGLNFLLSLGVMCALALPAVVELAVVSLFKFCKYGVAQKWSSELKTYVDGLASESGEATSRMEASALNGKIRAAKSAPQRASL